MSAGALVFMAASWTFVLGLAFWAFRKVLRSERRARGRGPDDGPAPPRAPPGP